MYQPDQSSVQFRGLRYHRDGLDTIVEQWLVNNRHRPPTLQNVNPHIPVLVAKYFIAPAYLDEYRLVSLRLLERFPSNQTADGQVVAAHLVPERQTSRRYPVVQDAFVLHVW